MSDDREEISKYSKDITIEEALPILRDNPWRIRLEDNNWGSIQWPQIFYENKWITICRTDLYDDVATGLDATKTIEEWRAYYLTKLEKAHGVRIYNDRDSIAIIDSMTDG